MYRETWKLYWVAIYRRDKILEKIMNKSLVYQYMAINCRVFHLIRVGCIFRRYFNNKSPNFRAIVFGKITQNWFMGPNLQFLATYTFHIISPMGPRLQSPIQPRTLVRHKLHFNLVSRLAQHSNASQAAFQFLRKIKFQSVMEGFEPRPHI